MDASELRRCVVALTDCDREAAVAFIRRRILAGVKDPSA